MKTMKARTLLPVGLLLAALLPMPSDALAAQQGAIEYTHTRRIDFELPPGVEMPRGMTRVREDLPEAQTRTVTLRFTPQASLMTGNPDEEGVVGAMFGNRLRGDRAPAGARGRVADAEIRGMLQMFAASLGAFGLGGGDQVTHTYVSHGDDALVETREFMGRTFRVTSPRPELEWRMTTEQAEHLGRMVVKATATRERRPAREIRPGRGRGPGAEGGPARQGRPGAKAGRGARTGRGARSSSRRGSLPRSPCRGVRRVTADFRG